MGSRRGSIAYAPQGDPLYSGMELGGNVIYPWSDSLAITPPASYSNYIGSANALPVTPPVSSLTGTAGSTGSSVPASQVQASPFGRNSPLPWVIGGLILAVVAMYTVHYRRSGD